MMCKNALLFILIYEIELDSNHPSKVDVRDIHDTSLLCSFDLLYHPLFRIIAE